MSRLKDEIRAIQNPALGAYLQWRYSISYTENHSSSENTPAILLFVILPILYHKDTFQVLSSTKNNSGLAKFTSKFTDSALRKSDILLNIHERSLRLRDISFRAMRIGIASGLFFLDSKSGRIFPISDVNPIRAIPTIINKMGKEAEKLGFWFSQVSLNEISSYLKVGF
jgi:hypothetical protein